MAIRNVLNITMKMTLHRIIIEINIELAIILWFRDTMFINFRQDIQ